MSVHLSDCKTGKKTKQQQNIPVLMSKGDIIRDLVSDQQSIQTHNKQYNLFRLFRVLQSLR